MKLLYWLVPFLGVTACAACYHHWNQGHAGDRAEVVERAKMLNELQGDYRGRDGGKEALADLARGTPKLKSYGLPVHWIREYGEVLARDYGVTHQAIAGCVVTDSLLRYAADYNEVVAKHLKANHGADVFDVAAHKAEALYDERRSSRTSSHATH